MSGDRLHGRTAELEAVTDAVDAVARGGQSVVIVRGEAGIGKTALLTELRDRARAHEFVVLEGRATELERDAPLVPLIDALDGQLPGPAALAALGPERLGLLAEVFPGLAPAGAGEASGAERWRLHRAIGELLTVTSAGRPLLLLVDDVHWADPATQELLEHIIRRPPSDSLLVALGLRPSSVSDRLLAAQRSSDEFQLIALDLKPLDRAEAELLMGDVSEARERDRLFAQSGGNPLLLRALARHGGTEHLPDGILAAVAVEIESLPQTARELVRAAAVVGAP